MFLCVRVREKGVCVFFLPPGFFFLQRRVSCVDVVCLRVERGRKKKKNGAPGRGRDKSGISWTPMSADSSPSVWLAPLRRTDMWFAGLLKTPSV